MLQLYGPLVWRNFTSPYMYTYVLLPVSVDQCVERQPIAPASGEVGHSDITIPTQENWTC